MVMTCSTQPTETNLKLPSGFSALLATSVTTLAAGPRCAAGSLPVRVVRPGRGQARPRNLAVVSVSFRTCTLQTCSPRKRQIWANGRRTDRSPFAPSWCPSTTTVSPCSKNSSAVAHTCHTHRAPPEGGDRRLLSLMPPRAGKTRVVVAHPDEVVGPQIEHPLEITFAVALVALPQRVRLAGDATLLSSAEIRQRRRVRGR